MDFIPNSVMRWLGPGVIIGLGMVSIFGFPIGQSVLCDPDKNCFISWAGALSGWAALAGAFITIAVMRDQLSEQKRQSDFLVGDAEPDFILLRNRKANTVALRTTNWNRRSIMIENVTCIEPHGLEMSGIRDEKKTPGLSASKGVHPTFLIDGWLNRNAEPTVRRLLMSFSKEGVRQKDVAKDGIQISVEVTYRIIGQVHERRKSRATALEIVE